MNNVCGIDSGKEGAFVVIFGSTGNVVSKYVMPLKDGELDLDGLCELIQSIQEMYEPLFVLEQLQPIFGAGKGSQFSMAQTYGCILGSLHCKGVNYTLSRPKSWQKSVILPEDRVLKKSKKGDKMVNDPKATSLKCFQRLYPGVELFYGDNEPKQSGRRTKQNEGMVDAALIGRSQLNTI